MIRYIIGLNIDSKMIKWLKGGKRMIKIRRKLLRVITIAKIW